MLSLITTNFTEPTSTTDLEEEPLPPIEEPAPGNYLENVPPNVVMIPEDSTETLFMSEDLNVMLKDTELNNATKPNGGSKETLISPPPDLNPKTTGMPGDGNLHATNSNQNVIVPPLTL